MRRIVSLASKLTGVAVELCSGGDAAMIHVVVLEYEESSIIVRDAVSRLLQVSRFGS